MVNPSEHPPEENPSLTPVHRLLHHSPFAFWAVVWGIVVFVGTLATMGMLNPGKLEPEASHPQPTGTTIQEWIKPQASPSKPSITTAFHEPTPQEGLPLSLFGGLALGCAAGSFVLTRVLKRSTQSQPGLKRSKLNRVKRKKRRSVSPRSESVNSQLTLHAPTVQEATTDQPDVQVTVLSAEENLILDGREQDLAEMLDLRKRKSLASLMRGQ